MTLFVGFPRYNRYRTLHVTDPLQRGADVYALQTALYACGFDPGPWDGVLGRGTGAAIRSAQAQFPGLIVDGLAGGKTQEALARYLANRASEAHKIATGALRGQLEHESGFRLGNYSPQRSDGSYDAGVAQRNTAHTPAQEGFNVPESINALALLVRKYHDLFDGLPPRRRWALAQGAWNAPAYACFLAREEGVKGIDAHCSRNLGPTARQTLEAYIQSVTSYLVV